MNITVEEFWAGFLESNPDVPKETQYQCWHFGNTRKMAAELAELVISGEKRATASLAAVNQLQPGQAPVPHGYSVITDLDGNPLCVVRTTEIRHMPFDKVDAGFAHDEGEGDRSLEYWRNVHSEYFAREVASLGLEFNERSVVCCERFELLYPR